MGGISVTSTSLPVCHYISALCNAVRQNFCSNERDPSLLPAPEQPHPCRVKRCCMPATSSGWSQRWDDVRQGQTGLRFVSGLVVVLAGPVMGTWPVRFCRATPGPGPVPGDSMPGEVGMLSHLCLCQSLVCMRGWFQGPPRIAASTEAPDPSLNGAVFVYNLCTSSCMHPIVSNCLEPLMPCKCSVNSSFAEFLQCRG